MKILTLLIGLYACSQTICMTSDLESPMKSTFNLKNITLKIETMLTDIQSGLKQQSDTANTIETMLKTLKEEKSTLTEIEEQLEVLNKQDSIINQLHSGICHIEKILKTHDISHLQDNNDLTKKLHLITEQYTKQYNKMMKLQVNFNYLKYGTNFDKRETRMQKIYDTRTKQKEDYLKQIEERMAKLDFSEIMLFTV